MNREIYFRKEYIISIFIQIWKTAEITEISMSAQVSVILVLNALIYSHNYDYGEAVK